MNQSTKKCKKEGTISFILLRNEILSFWKEIFCILIYVFSSAIWMCNLIRLAFVCSNLLVSIRLFVLLLSNCQKILLFCYWKFDNNSCAATRRYMVCSHLILIWVFINWSLYCIAICCVQSHRLNEDKLLWSHSEKGSMAQGCHFFFDLS